MRRGLVLAICLAFAGTMAAAPISEALAGGFLTKAKKAVRKAAKSIEGAVKNGTVKVTPTLDGLDLNLKVVVVSTPDGPVNVTRKKPAKGSYGVKAQAGAGIGLSAAEGSPGSPVTVDAIGVPKNAQMSLAIGQTPDDAAQIADAKSTDDGQVTASVKIPDSASPGDNLVFVLASQDKKVRLVSEPFKVVAAGSKDQVVSKDQKPAGDTDQNGGQAVDSVSAKTD